VLREGGPEVLCGPLERAERRSPAWILGTVSHFPFPELPEVRRVRDRIVLAESLCAVADVKRPYAGKEHGRFDVEPKRVNLVGYMREEDVLREGVLPFTCLRPGDLQCR
jgi:hypothetical protein